jgi:hypothetical protein
MRPCFISFCFSCLQCIAQELLVTVRQHLAGRELLLSSRYTVLLRCSSSREHEFLISGNLTCDWVATSRTWKVTGLFWTKHCYTGRTWNMDLHFILGNSKCRSSVRVVQAVAFDRSYVRATQAVTCDRHAPLALGIKLCLCDNPHFSPHISKYCYMFP